MTEVVGTSNRKVWVVAIEGMAEDTVTDRLGNVLADV